MTGTIMYVLYCIVHPNIYYIFCFRLRSFKRQREINELFARIRIAMRYDPQQWQCSAVEVGKCHMVSCATVGEF